MAKHKRRRATKKRGRLVEQVITSRDRVVFDGRRPRPDPFAPRRFEPLEPATAPEAMTRRHERATFVPTPPTYEHPTRPFYRRGQRIPFLQPSPPELQGYGDTDESHYRLGSSDADHAKTAALESINAAKRGRCVEANLKLHVARTAAGKAQAHGYSIMEDAGGKRIDVLGTNQRIRDAESAFHRSCKVTRRK